MNFKELKERIKIVYVLHKYGVSLRTRPGAPSPTNEYGGAICPLPCHPAGERDTTFYVHLPSNRWQCKHDDCKKRNGVGELWGDCINLVAVMENCSFKDAGRRLEQWFGKENPAQHIAAREEGKGKNSTNPPHIPDSISSAIAVNGKGYMHDTGLWIEELLSPIVENLEIRKVLKKALLDKIHESFRNGKAQRA